MKALKTIYEFLKSRSNQIFVYFKSRFDTLLRIFYEDGLGNPSSRKIYAFLFCGIALIEKFKLVMCPKYHFSTILTQLKVSDAVIITLIASVDAFAFAALAVYGWKENANKSSTPVAVPTVAKKGSVKTSEEA